MAIFYTSHESSRPPPLHIDAIAYIRGYLCNMDVAYFVMIDKIVLSLMLYKN